MMLLLVVQSLSCVRLCGPMDCSAPGFLVLHRLPELAQTRVHWVGDAIQPSHPLSPRLPLSSTFPSIRVFSQHRLLASGGQSVGASASASVLPMDIQDWFPFGWTGWISLQSKGLSRVFSNPTVQRHQFFGAQPSLCSNPHLSSIHDYWKNLSFNYTDLCQQRNVSAL